MAFAATVHAAAAAASPAATAPADAKITILYDAFGKSSDLERGWGYSALIEYGGKRILFDTGGQYDVFAHNVQKLHIDLTHLDFVVLSHRHGDHTSGLAYVLQQNPSVQIFAPAEAGSFGTPIRGDTAKGASRHIEGVATDLAYYSGGRSDVLPVDSPWPGAHIRQIDQANEVLPGFFLFRTVSDVKGTLELNELSMGFNTPKGMVVVVGCSHPGIEKILTAATVINPNLYTVVGGLHLLDKPDAEVSQIIDRLHDKWKLERLAAGHCSGEFAQHEMERIFGTRHDHSGLGEEIGLPMH